jgi:DNA repair exonuclease SbcCD nuclease subunit
MNILVSCDYHLKLSQKSVPKDWAINRYRILFEEIHKLESKVTLHVIAGDLFDKLPSMEELSLYFEFIKKSTVETIIIPGNHCAVGKSTTFLTHLKEVTNAINPLVRIIDNYYTYQGLDFIPYNCLKDFEKNGNDSLQSDVLFTHCRGAIPPYVKPEVDLSIFDRFKIVLLGDLHSRENSQRNLNYPGSPLTTSFHRTKVDTGVIIFNTEDHNIEWIKITVPQLIRKTIRAGDPMVATDYDHTIYELEGDMSELGTIADNDLIDKKLVTRSTDTTLILDPNMSLQEEVQEYLLYVLELDQKTVDAAIDLLNNNMNKIDD